MEAYQSKNEKDEESIGGADLQSIATMYNLLRVEVDSSDRTKTRAAYAVKQQDELLTYENCTLFKEVSGQGGGGITDFHLKGELGKELKKDKWATQFGDAEAKIMVTIWDWPACYNNVKRDIYIYVTKGPCQSCRQLFKNYVRVQTKSRIIVMWTTEVEQNDKRITYGIPELKKTKLCKDEIYLKIYAGRERK